MAALLPQGRGFSAQYVSTIFESRERQVFTIVDKNRLNSSEARQHGVGAQLLCFTVLAFVFSWGWWLPMALTGAVVRNGSAWPSHLPGLLGPALAAIITVAAFRGRVGLAELWSRMIRWRFPWMMWVVLAVTLALVTIPLFTNPNATAAEYLVFSGAPQIGILTVLYILIVNGFGEEIGWRGFLADSLMERHRLGVIALIVWTVWGAWHIPLFWVVQNFRELGPVGVVGWSAGLLSGSVVLTWLYSTTRRSILFVAIWHTVFNFATATTASAGVGAAVASTVVIAFSLVVVCLPSFWRRPVPDPASVQRLTRRTPANASAVNPPTNRH